MKKMWTVVLAMMMIMILSVTALAEDLPTRNSNYFASYGTVVSAQGGGMILITFSTTALDVASQLGVATWSVERRNAEGYWEDVTGLFPGETGSGFVSYTFNRNFIGVPGETYKVHVTFLCSMNGGVETKSHTSGIVTAK